MKGFFSTSFDASVSVTLLISLYNTFRVSSRSNKQTSKLLISQQSANQEEKKFVLKKKTHMHDHSHLRKRENVFLVDSKLEDKNKDEDNCVDIDILSTNGSVSQDSCYGVHFSVLFDLKRNWYLKFIYYRIFFFFQVSQDISDSNNVIIKDKNQSLIEDGFHDDFSEEMVIFSKCIYQITTMQYFKKQTYTSYCTFNNKKSHFVIEGTIWNVNLYMVSISFIFKVHKWEKKKQNSILTKSDLWPFFIKGAISFFFFFFFFFFYFFFL